MTTSQATAAILSDSHREEHISYIMSRLSVSCRNYLEEDGWAAFKKRYREFPDALRSYRDSTIVYLVHAMKSCPRNYYGEKVLYSNESRLRLKARCWEYYQSDLSDEVNSDYLFTFMNTPSDKERNDRALKRYIYTAQAITALALAESFTFDNQRETNRYIRYHAQYVDFFRENSEHSMRLMDLIANQKVLPIDDLKYHLGIEGSLETEHCRYIRYTPD